MLMIYTVLIMLIIAYAQCREGLFSAASLVVQVILAGLLTFNFWEPLADELNLLFADGALAGYEDTFVLTLLFTVFLILLRVAVNKLAPHLTEFPGTLQQLGGALFGCLTGYLVAGFLVCILQTLPWHENFMGFRPRTEGESGLRKFWPPDRVWLAIMRHAGAQSLAWKLDQEDAGNPYDRYQTFDGSGTFELRYLRYRRHGDQREPLKYQGELERELKRKTPLNFP